MKVHARRKWWKSLSRKSLWKLNLLLSIVVEDGDEKNKTRILNENDRILFLFSPVETDRRKEKMKRIGVKRRKQHQQKKRRRRRIIFLVYYFHFYYYYYFSWTFHVSLVSPILSIWDNNQSPNLDESKEDEHQPQVGDEQRRKHLSALVLVLHFPVRCRFLHEKKHLQVLQFVLHHHR